MGSATWQTGAALLVMGAAAGYLSFLAWQALRGSRAGCGGGCRGCGTGKSRGPDAPAGFVAIDHLTQTAQAELKSPSSG